MQYDFISRMPKAELHIHLEGAVNPKTLLELAERHDRLDLLPGSDYETLEAWYEFRDFEHFVTIFMTIQSLIRTAADVELIAYQCGQDMANQNIRYREVTVTPYTHTHIQQEKGLDIGDLLTGLSAGRQRARDEFGVEMRWVFDIPRNAAFDPDGRYNAEPGEVTLEYARLGQAHGVIGFGLGGFEHGAPPNQFASVFSQARATGLALLPHAGETAGPESIWGAVRDLGADRIGHGVRAIEDPQLLVYLCERQIPLEVSLISNVRLSVFESLAHHPFPHLDRMGLKLTLSSDDPSLFSSTLSNEYRALQHIYGYSAPDIARIARNSFQCAMAEQPLKDRLLAEFDDWDETEGGRSGQKV